MCVALLHDALLEVSARSRLLKQDCLIYLIGPTGTRAEEREGERGGSHRNPPHALNIASIYGNDQIRKKQAREEKQKRTST